MSKFVASRVGHPNYRIIGMVVTLLSVRGTLIKDSHLAAYMNTNRVGIFRTDILHQDSLLPRTVGHHGKSSFRKLIVDGIVNSTQIHTVVQEFAVESQEQTDGLWFVFHGCQV